MSTELPLTRDPASRYVPWIVGLMMYLAALAGFLFLVTFHFFGEWSNDLSSHFMIEIPMIDIHGTQKTPENLLKEQKMIEDILSHFDTTIQYQVLTPRSARQALLPLMGKPDGKEKTKQIFPMMIDVEKNPLLPMDLIAFSKTLQDVDPQIRLIESGEHYKSTRQMALTVEIFLLTLMSLFFVAALMSLSFSTTTSLLIHKDIIEILSLIGASDTQISFEFQKHARHLAVWGGGFSYIFLFITFAFGVWVFWDFDPNAGAIFFLNTLVWDMFLTCLIPPFFGLLMLGFARLKAERLLAQFAQKSL